jgi:hypothetical protein
MMAQARAAIARGVSPNVRNDLGETPLLLAATNGHGEMVKLLLLHGANPALPDMFGETAISVAQAKGHTDIVNVLSSTTRRDGLSSSPTSTHWQPNARLWLVACITLGISLVMGLAYFFCRQPITAEQFLRLAEANQIRDVSGSGGYLFGELGDRFQSGRDPVWMPSRKFWLPEKEHESAEKEIDARARAINPKYSKYSNFSSHKDMPLDFWPGNWAFVTMSALPMAILGIPLWFLVGLDRYPSSILSSSRRNAMPGGHRRERPQQV